MANPVVQTAVCTCSFGMAPAVMTVTSQQTVTMCGCPANPAVAAATAAAIGALTPAPCVPATVSWAPGCPTVTVCGRPLLNNTSKLMCPYGGVIQVTVTPAMTVKVP